MISTSTPFGYKVAEFIFAQQTRTENKITCCLISCLFRDLDARKTGISWRCQILNIRECQIPADTFELVEGGSGADVYMRRSEDNRTCDSSGLILEARRPENKHIVSRISFGYIIY